MTMHSDTTPSPWAAPAAYLYALDLDGPAPASRLPCGLARRAPQAARRHRATLGLAMSILTRAWTRAMRIQSGLAPKTGCRTCASRRCAAAWAMVRSSACGASVAASTCCMREPI